MGRVDDSFIQYLTDQLSDWATITARRMFGGWGLYRGALMFAIVQNDQLYLKCGDAVRAKADGAELSLFTYEKPAKTKEKGPPKPPKAKEPDEQDEDGAEDDDTEDDNNNDRKVTLNFALIDADTIEDSEALCLWADCAWQDALSAQRTKSATQTHGAQPSSSKRQGLGRRGTPSS